MADKSDDIKNADFILLSFTVESRDEIEKIIGDFEYITAFPTAGGHMKG